MITNKVSAQIGSEALTRVKSSISAISQDLPFLIDLTTEEKKQLPKFGDRSVAFVSKTLEFAKQYSDVIPRSLSIEEFEKDVVLYNQLFAIMQPMRVLMDKLEDTFAQTGSEAYSTALAIYGNLKVNKDLFEGSGNAIDELSKRFVQKTQAAAAETVPA